MDTVFFTNQYILSMMAVALFAAVIFRIIKNKIVSIIVSVVSFTLMLACIVYALLLGAQLTEVLIFVLAFTLLYSLSFIPTNKNTNDIEEQAADGFSQSSESDDNKNGHVYNKPEKDDEAKREKMP